MKKNFLMLMFGVLVIAYSCNKEPAIEPKANFSTNIENNTLEPAQGFTVYFHETEGEFVTYFKGDRESKTYSPDDPTREGVFVTKGTDSVTVGGYSAAELSADTTYTFTVVASSSGNWGEEYLQDVQSIQITVSNPDFGD